MRAILLFIFFIVLTLPLAAQMPFEQKILIPQPKENASRYYYLPFEVSARVSSLTLTYTYDRKGSANTLDLGVFDTNFDQAENSLEGLRGWSGGRRNQIFISETDATNGYIAGPIQPGTWRVVFGLYKVAPEGVEVTVKVSFNDVSENLLQQPSEEENKSFTLPTLAKLSPAETFGGYKWFRGDLHVHTFHSDGNWTYPLIFDWAEAAGLDFVGLPDHNTASHHAEINRLAPKYKNLLLLRGQEVTTYGGHFNVWGLPTGEVIDFRMTPKDSVKLQKSIDSVRKLGLIASLNHPTALCGGCDWSYGGWTKMDSVELWNGIWSEEDEAALKKWDELLQSGGRVSIIGSSDTHNPPLGNPPPIGSLPLSTPTNHVGMKNLAQADLLNAIKSGRVWISDEPKNYKLEFSAESGKSRAYLGDEISAANKAIQLNFKTANFPGGSNVLVISNGNILFNEKTNNPEYSFNKTLKIEKDSYFRIEVRDQTNKMLALTNPIFVKT